MILTAEKISRSFPRGSREFYALQETDITLAGGRMTVLQGRSGSGKTTLLNILAGLQSPSSGRVLAQMTRGAEVGSVQGEMAPAATDLYSLDDKELSRFRNDHYKTVLRKR